MLVFFSLAGFSQDKRVILDVGVIARTTVFYKWGTRHFSYGPTINYDAPYSYRAGINGLGINTSLGYILSKKHQVNFLAGGNFRYDSYNLVRRTSTFYVDGSAFFSKSIFKNYYVGVGGTVHNIGKELEYNGSNNVPKTLELQFNSVDFLLGVPLWKIFIEPKVSIVQQDFPGDIKDNATLFTFRTYYRFN
jgi:hypothetical protein